MKLGFLINVVLLAALILAQEDMEGMDSEMEDDEDNGSMEMMAMEMMQGTPSMPPPPMGGKNETAMEPDGRKKNKGMKDLYMAAMLVKSVIGTMLSFVSPVMQVKGFGLSVINTIVNVARFLLDMRRMMPMIRSAMAGWSNWGRVDSPPTIIPTIANRKTIQVPDYGGFHKFYKPSFLPDRHLYPPVVKPLTGMYLPATTYAPHRSPFRHYYTRYNKDLTTPTSQWSHYDDSNNFIRKSLDLDKSVSSTKFSPTEDDELDWDEGTIDLRYTTHSSLKPIGRTPTQSTFDSSESKFDKSKFSAKFSNEEPSYRYVKETIGSTIGSPIVTTFKSTMGTPTSPNLSTLSTPLNHRPINALPTPKKIQFVTGSRAGFVTGSTEKLKLEITEPVSEPSVVTPSSNFTTMPTTTKTLVTR